MVFPHIYLVLVLTITKTSICVSEGWFLHVTDFHWDNTYTSRDLSCNGVVNTHGVYGDYWCDSPFSLIDVTIKAMKNATIDKAVDFMLWTGDSILHTGDEHLSIDNNIEMLTNLTNNLQQTFPTMDVYATYGNHDYYPNGQYPPHNNEIYNRTLEHWRSWINDSTQEELFLKGAYYTLKTKYGIRILALNTNLYYTSDKITAHMDDPADQFVWMENILEHSRHLSEKVLITGHVPPGVAAEGGKPWFYQHFNTRMVHILQQYSDIIIGLHFGHEHADTFRLFYDHSGQPTMAMYIAPSVTPWRYKNSKATGPKHNPSFRMVKYDRVSGRHLDLVQYYMDLPESNRQGKPIWKIAYTATHDMGISDISPKSMDNFATRTRNPHSQEFQNQLSWRNAKAEVMPCDAFCHSLIFCNFKKLHDHDFKLCLRETQQYTATLPFGRRK
ncbi:acid sphingomyelinase-like phosphodiesterase 3b [Saccostrea cucullata]|uniref:acid sphingomyelinase-like phosphodiesterase 3b n=1 Tax=Saccostrea cuccullata TaxID=36930 RepID=UPI002ED51DDE